MIIISIFALLFLFINYDSLGTLVNPGFVSLYDQYLFRKPFYNSEWILRYLEKQQIHDRLFGELTTQVQGTSSPIAFTFAPFWVYVDRWLMAMFFIAMILLVINRILVLIKVLPEYIADIPVYSMIILSIAGYYLAVRILGGYMPQKTGFHTTVLLLVIYSVFAIVLGIIRKKSVDGNNSKPEEKEKNKNRMMIATIVVIIQVLVFIILPGKFMIDAIKLSADYRNTNLGSFDPYKMTVRYDLERNGFAGNFANQAVDTENGLYFIERETDLKDSDEDAESYETESFERRITYIRKLDENGSITDICKSKSDDSKRDYNYINIGYANGYIYASTNYYISRIDPKDGLEVEVITAATDYIIAEMCVVDDKLYYMEIPEDYESSMISSAWVCEIKGDDLSKPQLYTSDLDRGVFTRFNQFDSSSLLTNMVIGDFLKDRYWQGGRYQKCDGRSFYVREGYGWNDKYVPTQLIIVDDSDPKNAVSIEKVGGFNIYNESIYYVQLKENGLDVCKCDLNGSNTEVLDTYTCDIDLSKNSYQSIYRVIIGQGKIYVSAIGDIFPKDAPWDGWYMDYGSIQFMTDLK